MPEVNGTPSDLGVENTSSSEVNTEETSEEVPEAETAAELESDKEDLSKQSLLRDLYSERNKRKELKAKLDELTQKSEEMSTLSAEHESLKAKHARLEAVLLVSGSTMARLLDSRSFSERVFNSDENVEDIIADWYKANPSNTSNALKSAGDVPREQKTSMNDLLRAAAR